MGAEEKIQMFRGMLTAVVKEYPESYIKVEDLINVINVIIEDGVGSEDIASILFSKLFSKSGKEEQHATVQTHNGGAKQIKK